MGGIVLFASLFAPVQRVGRDKNMTNNEQPSFAGLRYVKAR
jgi:hypothetical protein